LFSLDQPWSLHPQEFSIFIQNFIHGLSCAFGLCIPCSGAKARKCSLIVFDDRWFSMLMIVWTNDGSIDGLLVINRWRFEIYLWKMNR
jgi:hypothetical protein